MKINTWTLIDGIEFGSNVKSIALDYPMITFELGTIVTPLTASTPYKSLKCLGGYPLKKDIEIYKTNVKEFINSIPDDVLVELVNSMDFDIEKQFTNILYDLM